MLRNVSFDGIFYSGTSVRKTSYSQREPIQTLQSFWILKPGFAADFYFHNFTKQKVLNLAHYFPYDVKLRILAHSRSFLANQKARNAIFGAEN